MGAPSYGRDVEPRVVRTDDELASFDVLSLITDGLGGEGRLRSELEGEGAVAAAVQLERAGIEPSDVAQAVTEVRAGDVLQGSPPSALDRLLAAADGQDSELLARWLERVMELMVMRERR
jgi:hypothetical protein